MEHLERARQLRADTGVHYNCCQSVLVPFARELGLNRSTVSRTLRRAKARLYRCLRYSL